MAIPVERHRDAEATASRRAWSRPFLLRRKKSDPGIAPELPPKTETDLVVPLTAEQVTLYEAVVRETMAEIAANRASSAAGLVLKLLTALKQICNHPAQYLGQAGPLAGRSGKLAAFDELSDLILAGGESMLVFTQYVEMGTLLERHLGERGIGSLFLHGGVPVPAPEEMVDRFQAGEVPVFLLSLKAGGTGLNLTRATHVCTTTAGGTRRSRTRPPIGPTASARTAPCRCTAWSPRARSRTVSRPCWRPSASSPTP